MGQRETVTFGGDNKVVLMGFDLNVHHDVYLDTIDELDGDYVHCLFFRMDLFEQSEAEMLAMGYRRLIETFAADPRLFIEAVDLSQPEDQDSRFLNTTVI